MWLLCVADPFRVAILSSKSKGLKVRSSRWPARYVDQSLLSAQELQTSSTGSPGVSTNALVAVEVVAHTILNLA
jgi:hypothetical protein